MDNFTILAIALGLSFDTFAVSLSYGVIRNSILFRQAIRVATILAVFQGGLTVAGYFLGSFISSAVLSLLNVISFALLEIRYFASSLRFWGFLILWCPIISFSIMSL